MPKGGKRTWQLPMTCVLWYISMDVGRFEAMFGNHVCVLCCVVLCCVVLCCVVLCCGVCVCVPKAICDWQNYLESFDTYAACLCLSTQPAAVSGADGKTAPLSRLVLHTEDCSLPLRRRHQLLFHWTKVTQQPNRARMSLRA